MRKVVVAVLWVVVMAALRVVAVTVLRVVINNMCSAGCGNCSVYRGDYCSA